eukprot:498290_1
MQQIEDLDIPTLTAIANFTGVWVSDYSKYLKTKQINCTENNQQFVSSNLEFFGLIIYGIFSINGFRLKNNKDNDKDTIPWRCDSNTKSFIKFEFINNGYPSNWVFTVKLTSLFASNYIMTVNTNLIHTITKLPNIQNWKVIFKISKALHFKSMISSVFNSPLSQSFALLIGNEIYQTYLKKFWNLWQLHFQNINELTYDENKIIQTFTKHKTLLESFKSFKNSNHKLPYSLLTLRHIYLAFLCHLILQHLEWESFGLSSSTSSSSLSVHDDEEKAMMIDNDTLYDTPQGKDIKDDDNDNEMKDNENENENNSNKNKLYDYSLMSNDVIATTVTRCMRYHRPFDMNYKIILPNGQDVKHIKIRYISMEHCALFIVNDKELLKCNLASPKVNIPLNRYINEDGEIKNLSGRYGLIKLLCQNIVRRAKDPLETSCKALGLMSSKVFSTDVLIILFGFLNWRDLMNFGYCSQLAYNISNESEIWKLMYMKEFMGSGMKDMNVANWKNKFLAQYIQRKSGTDDATQELIKKLMRQ